MKSKTILVMLVIGLFVSQTAIVAANPLVWVGGAVVIGLCLLGTCVAEEYVSSSSDCSPSPMCDVSYCVENPEVCRMFKGKTVNCCDGTIVVP